MTPVQEMEQRDEVNTVQKRFCSRIVQLCSSSEMSSAFQRFKVYLLSQKQLLLTKEVAAVGTELAFCPIVIFLKYMGLEIIHT